MIRVDFREPDTADWRQWRDDANTARDQLIKDVKKGKAPEIDADLYKRMKKVIFDAFSGKCAYCESQISADQPGDVEHFRPKGRVMGEDGKPVLIKLGNKEVPHPGYYWLAYDWRNLLPACARCNRPEAIDGEKTTGK